MKIVLLSGKMRAGKNTVAQMIQEEMPDKKVIQESFAKAVKDGAAEDFLPLMKYLNSFVEEVLPDLSEKEFSVIKKFISQLMLKPENFYEDKTELSRCLLQIYGTNIFRNRVDSDYWIYRFLERIENYDCNLLLVTDWRYPNEYTSLEENLIILENEIEICKIRINRKASPLSSHPTEIALDKYSGFDFVIENDGTLDELRETVKQLVKQL